MNLNNGYEKKKHAAMHAGYYCSTKLIHGSQHALLHCFFFVFFFMVTIVEVHMLIIDVCVWLSDTTENQTVWKVLYINWLSQNHWLLESLLL